MGRAAAVKQLKTFLEGPVGVDPCCGDPEVPAFPDATMTKLHEAWENTVEVVYKLQQDTKLPLEMITALLVVNAAYLNQNVVNGIQKNPFPADWLFQMGQRTAQQAFDAAHHNALVWVPYLPLKYRDKVNLKTEA
jgi:hypothetical protein